MSTSSPLADIRAAERLGHQIDGLGRAPHEDDLAQVRRVQELLNFLASVLIRASGALAEEMHAAMDIGVVFGVAAHHRVDDGLRLLRGRRVVEIDERLAVYFLAQDREVAPHLLDVESGCDAAASKSRVTRHGATVPSGCLPGIREPARSSRGSGCRPRMRAPASRAIRRRRALSSEGRTSPRHPVDR